MLEAASPVHASRRAAPADDEPWVFVVDHDASVRESLEGLAASAGWQVRTFATAADFLAHAKPCAPTCVVLDVALPDLNGLAVQARLASQCVSASVVFIAHHVDVPTTVQAMKAGAFEFLLKPLREAPLVEVIERALAMAGVALRRDRELAMIRSRHASLTPREAEVMALVVAGRLNKQAAGELAISEITVKAHRGKLMRKMMARTLPDLVRMAGRLGIA